MSHRWQADIDTSRHRRIRGRWLGLFARCNGLVILSPAAAGLGMTSQALQGARGRRLDLLRDTADLSSGTAKETHD